MSDGWQPVAVQLDMSKVVTIKDVAREAGVCIGTVSRVLNGKDRVHPQTCERIQAVIRRLGYRPSVLGRGLVTRRSHNVMLLVHNIADPFCVALAKHLSGLCRKQGYKLLLGDSDYAATLEAECLEMARDGGIDGLIVAPVGGRHNQSQFRRLAKTGFPVVAVDESLAECLIPCFRFDDRLAGRIAADHLLDQGHRHIAFVDWHTEFQTVADRYQGYLESHAARNVPVSDRLHLKLPASLRDARNVLAAALGMPLRPSALLAVNEMVALACFSVLNQLGCRVPEDVALMAFGDMFPDGSTPKPVSTVSLPVERLAERAWSALWTRIQTGTKPDSLTKVERVAPALSIRQTA